MPKIKKELKTKSKTSKIKTIRPIIIEQESKAIDKNGYPIPKSETCFRCEKKFWLTFVSLKQNYARRNYWFYWTEKESDKGKFICSPCLRNIFLEDKEFYLENIRDIKKKRMISSYTCSQSI